MTRSASLIRERANEFGTTTGRPRRVGWFDSVAARYSVRINGYTSLVLTRLDVLDNFDSFKLCSYYELDGESVCGTFPGSAAVLGAVQAGLRGGRRLGQPNGWRHQLG